MKFEDAIDLIKRRVDLLEVIGRYVKLRKSGQNYWGLCPFHNEKTSSFSVRPDKGFFNCFGCGESGDVFTFLEKTTGQTFSEIVVSLSEELNIEIDGKFSKNKPRQNDRKKEVFDALLKANLFFKNQLTQNKTAMAYLVQNRKLDRRQIEEFELGFGGENETAFMTHLRENRVSDSIAIEAGLIREGTRGPYPYFSGRITIPITDLMGRVVAFGGRLISNDQEGRPKYVNSPQSSVYDKSVALFGLNKAMGSLKKGAPLVLVEGYFDTMAICQSGFASAAPCGTSLTPRQVELIKRSTKQVTLCFDDDAAGKKAELKAIHMLLSNDLLVKKVLLAGKDPAHLVETKRHHLLKEALISAPDAIEYLAQRTAQSAMLSIQHRIRAIDALLPFLAAPKRDMVSLEYTRMAARKLNEDEQTLLKEVRKLRPSAAKNPPAKKTIQNPRTKELSPSEVLLIRSMLSSPSIVLLPEVETIGLSPETKEFVENVKLSLSQSPSDPDIWHQIRIDRDGSVAKLMSQIKGDFAPMSQEDALKVISDLVRKAKDDKKRQILREHHKALVAAERSGDFTLVKEALLKQSENIKSFQDVIVAKEKPLATLQESEAQTPTGLVGRSEHDFKKNLEEFEEDEGWS